MSKTRERLGSISVNLQNQNETTVNPKMFQVSAATDYFAATLVNTEEN